jgi:hypothetical protein
MTEQMQARLHGGKDLVDLSLACIRSAAVGKRTERFRRLMCHEDVDVAQALAAFRLFTHEVASFVRQLRGFGAALLRMRQIGSGRLVPRRRERAAESADAQRAAGNVEIDRRRVGDVMKIRRQIAGGNGVEVVVVAVDPVDGRAEWFVAARLVGDVADAQPEGDFGVARDDPAGGGEVAMDVAERAEGYLVVCAGTSRSVLSQMKSLLL